MKKIGLIGGTSWQSTVEYYRIINEYAAERLAPERHLPKMIIESLDFGEVEAFINNQDFAGLSALLVKSALILENAGADMILICANTMHFFAPAVEANIHVPLVHMVDETIKKIKEMNLTCVSLLGTEFTMEQDFYKDRLIKQGIQVLIPEKEDRQFIHKTIFTELFKGSAKPETKKKFLEIIDSQAQEGAQGVILGCTEIPLVIKQQDCSIPVFDTTEIHAKAAVEFAIGN